jgi:hypothetical protein
MTNKKVKRENKFEYKYLIRHSIPLGVVLIFLMYVYHQRLSTSSDYCEGSDSCIIPIIGTEKNDFLNFTKEDIKAHNIEIISTLREREASESSKWASRQNSIDQLHAIYFGFLAVILSIILKGKTKKKLPYLLLFFLIPVMWWLNIHQQDLNNRSDYMSRNTGHNIEQFVNLHPTNATWYTLDYKAVKDSLDTCKNHAFIRKLTKFYKPSMEQIIFYIVPLCLVYVFMIINIKKIPFGFHLKRVKPYRKS